MSLIFVGQQFIIKSKQLITFNVPLCPFTTWNALNRFFFLSFFLVFGQRGTKIDCSCLFSSRFSVVSDSCGCCFWKSSTIERSFNIYHIAIRPEMDAHFAQIDVAPFIETFKADSSFLAGGFWTLFYLRLAELLPARWHANAIELLNISLAAERIL